jgi:hypothetical protein
MLTDADVCRYETLTNAFRKFDKDNRYSVYLLS